MNTFKKTIAALIRKPEIMRNSSLSYLLGTLTITIFIVSPLVDNSVPHDRWIMDAFLSLMALISIFIVERGPLRLIAILSFVLCICGLALTPLLVHQKHGQTISVVSGLVFCLNVSWIVARRVFNSSTSTLHRIRGAAIIYLNIALLFALVESWIAVFVPNSYTNIPANTGNTVGPMIYFSLATLTTIGYGDITPVHPFARSLATFEAVIGQFYMGTLIAALVGMHVSRKSGKQRDN